ncbi:tetratricopeptide repeat protein, partial [Holosporaceae bacterium 'Namur']|nr:tetratricopeptide repeat protein [Holosporaceae bacterium 'Namur']
EKLATLSKYLNLVVIFDNVSNDLNKNDLKDYLKAFNKDVIKIITTQNHFSKFYNLINLEFESIELTPFTIKEAKEYLEKQFFNGKRSDTEQELKSLIDKVGVLPEHLEIASKYLIEHTEESIARYINGLNQNSTSFMTQSTFFKALNTLSQEAQIIVKCLSRMDPSYIHYDLLEKLAPDKDSQTLKDIISELKSLSLLNPYIKDNLNGFKMNSGIGHGIKISSKFTDNQIDEINQIYNHLINNLHGILNATNISGSSDKAIQYKHKEHVLNILENFESEQVELEKSCKEKLVELYNDLSKLYFNENDYKEALKYSLKAYELISEYASNNHHSIAQNIYDLSQIYQSLKLSSKAFELLKYSYFECSYLKKEPCIKLDIIRENILSHNTNYNFKELNSRKFIKIKKFISDENLLEIRLKLQNIFANKIKEIDQVTVEDVKEESDLLNGMLNNNYIEEQLKNFNLEYSVNNIDFARMVAFETINLSIINSHERNCQKVKAFYQSYPEIVNKVAQSYPEFFVDEYIMFNCLEAIQSKVEFEGEVNIIN